MKAVDAAIEFAGGFLLGILNHDWLHQLIVSWALPELYEDPNDSVMNYFLTLGQNFSITTQHSVAFYLMLHGGLKLIVVWLLWKKKLWSYLPAVGVFSVLIIYEIYKFIHTFSIALLIFIILDITLNIFIILEYKELKAEKKLPN
jgi:uncharacterized membrane protein